MEQILESADATNMGRTTDYLIRNLEQGRPVTSADCRRISRSVEKAVRAKGWKLPKVTSRRTMAKLLKRSSK